MLNIIDISEANGVVDWVKVKPQIDGVILRVGYRGYGWQGTLVVDKQFHDNAAKCRALDIPFGVYWLSQATSDSEALAEAEFVHAHIKHYDLRLPVFLDSEWGATHGGAGRADQLNKQARTQYALTFLQKLSDYGYDTGLYTGPYWFVDNIDGEGIRARGHHIWLASVENVEPKIPYDAWQYSWLGKIDGVSTVVDMNYFGEELYRGMGKYFTDTEGHWAEAAIDKVKELGLMNGVTDQRFEPDAPLTRAQLASVLVRFIAAYGLRK